MLPDSPPVLTTTFEHDKLQADAVYPILNSSDEITADDYERTSSARSMSSLATSVDSQEPERDCYVLDSSDPTHNNKLTENGYFDKPPIVSSSCGSTPNTITPKNPKLAIPNLTVNTNTIGANGACTTVSGPTTATTTVTSPASPQLNNNNKFSSKSALTNHPNNSHNQLSYTPSNASSTSLPMLAQRSSSTSAISRQPSQNGNKTGGTNSMPPPVSATTNNNIKTSKRSSVSSQVSATSGNSIHRALTATISSGGTHHHRPSFSFSRRRSLMGQGVSTNSVHMDESSVSAQDIERLREMIVAQRESKKKRREFLEDERVLVGTKVSEGHQNFVTAYNMLTGIRVSVSRCNAKVNHELTDADFSARHKLAFDIGGNELTPSAKYDFKFKDYAPYVFRHLRELFKLDPADYLISLTSKYIVSELGSPGKSGSFFYFSRDYRFIIKTIHHSEHKMLRKILKDYYNHVKENPNTLVSQFYGLHRVKLPFGRKIHFIVMNNLFPGHRDVHRTYDLKGSTLGRFLPEEADDEHKFRRRSVVYKDLNWLKHEESIRLGPQKRLDFVKQLEIDVKLLKRLNIMDYSLLIGIHDLNKGNTENIRDSTLSVFEPTGEGSAMSKRKVAELRKALNATSPTALNAIEFAFDEVMRRDFTFYADSGGYRSTDENNVPLNEIYYLGIIDCLTPYTFSKRVETFWKGLSHTRPSISAIPATEYGDRFLNFIKSVLSQKKTLNPENAHFDGATDNPGAPAAAPDSTATQQQLQQQAAKNQLPAVTESTTEAAIPI